MRFDTAQHMKMGQHMRMAPRMIQSMEILQMPMMALQERIEQELESNVALEQVTPSTENDSPPSDSDVADSDRMDDKELVVKEDASADDFARLDAYESSYSDATDNEYSSSRVTRNTAGERDTKMDAMANVAARGESLTDQLLHQWSFAEVDADIAAVGTRLIAYIDADGMLGADLETILEQNQSVDGTELTLESLNKALREVQHWLEPPGVGARDAREALMLQLASLDVEDDEHQAWLDARTLLEHHYNDLLENRLPRIAQKAEVPMERITDAIGILKRLNLSPGRDLVDEDVPPIIPDIVVEYDEQNDEYIAGLSRDLVPMLRVEKKYEKMSKDRAVDKDTRDFVKNSVSNAQWLIESIALRNSTLLRVVRVVLARQREYFDRGPQFLKPLPMTEVADQLGVHVATVSRAVADKWMQTPKGLEPLRKFFSGGRETASGRDMSWDAVKATLQEIIDEEDKAKPLSDEALARALKDRGIDIARRTVVKYRQQLDIPPARRRKVHA